ncbi:glycoside hydrolase domain-containing protein [Amycolatopsis nalaikhensis]|uniref:DUF1906 domain-containing protein n=1 Tax=Amycolatopsis nalaikhensis TaxID=715472 RepID=A0ABY8XQQ3_9PSEU|nr:glycoside hydrolase domain-containing protein [Amycolatopsis sp. 2-2]WIV57979.1 DUF1906 domain-containing protein [Amycolatopsis sp. 2-2]
MDQKVLNAQQWVNATYHAVPGYQPCTENGVTGWATMFSLTHALQHELGITTLSTNFGPTTLSLLQQRGDVRPGYGNSNIIRILQHGLFCKGYWGGDTLGVYDSSTLNAVSDLKGDAGLDPSNSFTQPKVFKAILTMDAYVLLPGGSQEVRDIQQWLNRRYWTKASSFIIPSEGFYSRDVQTALMRALQYEFGVPEDQATGNFGPTTQNGLRAHQLSSGSTGVFVQLFSAACVFNGAVPSGDGPVRTAFKATFDTLLGDYVRAFQSFSALAVTGRGDYQTWAQLLISCGDPDRPVAACDTRFHITPSRAQAMRAAGYATVGRYLDEDPDSTLDKEIQPGELDVIFDGGLRVVPISQYGARDLGDFTYSQGFQHAQRAHDRAAGYGFNPGVVIYFAVDYDAMDEEITSNIVPYFHGVQAGLASKGKRYIAGVYGSRNVCSRVTDEAYAAYSFVSGMSWGFSGNLGFPMPANWSFTQIKEFQFSAGGDVFDLDRDAQRPGADGGAGRSDVGGAMSPVEWYLRYIDQLYATAQAYGSSDPSLRVMEFLRFPTYVDTYNQGWKVLIGDVDRAWIDYAQQHGPQRMTTFRDPFYGIAVDVDHFGAAANSIYLKDAGGADSVTRGDFGGWGGDLCTFYREWQSSDPRYSSGEAFCRDRLAKITVPSTFALDDLIDDVDGYLIGMAVRGGTPINQAMRAHYGGGHLTRFGSFFSRRHNGRIADVESAARSLLLADSDLVVAGFRAGLIGLSCPQPSDIPRDDLDSFISGYAKLISGLAG